MENEGLCDSFWFIVTGQYLAIYFDGSNFEIRRDHHARGTSFYLSDDREAIIHNRTYIGALYNHPDYDGDVFYISKEQKYLSQDGQWVDSTDDAVKVQLEPVPDYGGAEPPAPSPLSDPIIDPENPISADGVDLYYPDKLFTLYPITGDSLWLGDAGEFHNKLFFGGNPYSDGMAFQLTKHEGKTRIQAGDGKYLTVMMDAEIAEHLSEECKQHTRLTQCRRCTSGYTIGYTSEPEDCLSLVPKGLPSMFAFYDGLCYYRVNILKGSYAEVERVDNIEKASPFQFVA